MRDKSALIMITTKNIATSDHLNKPIYQAKFNYLVIFFENQIKYL